MSPTGRVPHDRPRTTRRPLGRSGRAGRPIGYEAVNYQWAKACELANVKDAHFHDLRAKSGTDAKRNGIDYQALLGHTKRDMSDRYVKARDVDRVTPNRKL